MSATVVSHRSDPAPSKLHSDLDTAPRSPVRRSTTPRHPSISPLSSVANLSPHISRGVTMQASTIDELAAAEASSPANPADGAALSDDGSSSLSDPEDDEEDDIRGHNGFLSGSGVAEELGAHPSLEVDSEAETERLDQTPNKLRKHANSVGRTPSKLTQAAMADDVLSNPPSPTLATGAGAASSTSTVATTGQKRKRSDSAESSLTSADSDLGASPRKRSHESLTEDLRGGRDVESAGADLPEAVEEPVEIEQAPLAAAKSTKGRKAKGRGRAKKEPIVEPELDPPETIEEIEEEPSEEAAAKTAEELKHKVAAAVVFEDLLKQFAAFREKLNPQRLAKVTADLQMLNAQNCQHPEYLRQVACLDARFAKQMNESSAWYRYKAQTLRKSAIAQRSQYFAQHFQTVREIREDVMYRLGEDWYNIQKERRQGSDAEARSHIFKFPAKKSEQIRQQTKYNHEVSILSGFAKYAGFPAAPDISGTDGKTAEDDLKAMKISKRAPPPVTHNHAVYMPSNPGAAARQSERQNERIAHEQFLEQTPWARPQGPTVLHGTPNLTHTPDWASEPGAHSSKHLVRHLGSGISRVNSPFATPIPQRRPMVDGSSSGTVALNSDPAEPPSSVIAAPPTMERLYHGHPPLPHPREQQGSPLPMPKHHHANGGGGGGADVTNFRNFSNFSTFSGASTIDATPESAEKTSATADVSAPPPSLSHQHVFDSSAFHHHDQPRKRVPDVFASTSFRPQENAFGTPVRLPASSGP